MNLSQESHSLYDGEEVSYGMGWNYFDSGTIDDLSGTIDDLLFSLKLLRFLL